MTTRSFTDEAAALQDDTVSDEIFAGPYTTATLVYMLAGEVSVYTDNPQRLQLLSECPVNGNQEWSLCRGDICRLLAARGVTLSVINRRKS